MRKILIVGDFSSDSPSDVNTFLSQHFMWIVGIIVIGVFLFQASRLLTKAKKIDREGIETDAMVSRVEEIFDSDNLSSTYTTYVEFRDEEGSFCECPMTLSSDVTYEVGDHVRIRYLPGERELVRPVE